jgi:hypothetical protein
MAQHDSSRSLEPDERIIWLGDYVDRGHDSEEVLDTLIELSGRCRLIPILGNPDEMMLKARKSELAFQDWMEIGGIVTLDSYGSSGRIDLVPKDDFKFLKSCLIFFEMDTHFFVHGNYDSSSPLDRQHEQVLRWLSLRDHVPGPHVSGKIAVVGHTPQAEILGLASDLSRHGMLLRRQADGDGDGERGSAGGEGERTIGTFHWFRTVEPAIGHIPGTESRVLHPPEQSCRLRQGETKSPDSGARLALLLFGPVHPAASSIVRWHGKCGTSNWN